ncbi:c(7)-type cytochrome triheme domain-containing protein [Kaarinaea lacus]
MRLIAKVLRQILIPALISVGLLAACDRYLTGTRSADYVVDSGVGMGKKWEDTREFAPQVKTEKLAEDGIHDPENDAIVVLQEPSDAMAAFPQDRRGGVDWVRAIQLGIIAPRADVKGETQMVTMDMDIMFKDTGSMPWVKFPHLAHTQWLACDNCHPNIFVPKKGANNPSMDGILAGEHCGRCHDKVAFALWICERCHNTPHENSPEKWWQEEYMQDNPPVSSGSETQ